MKALNNKPGDGEMNLSGTKQKWAREALPQRKTERRTFSAWGMIISFLRVLSDQLNAKKFMFYLKQRKAGQIIHTQKYNKKAGNILRKMIYILNLILKMKTSQAKFLQTHFLG